MWCIEADASDLTPGQLRDVPWKLLLSARVYISFNQILAVERGRCVSETHVGMPLLSWRVGGTGGSAAFR
jgi:hypothetical protein